MRAALALCLAALAPAIALAQTATTAGEQDNEVDARIRASAAAAESYQGPLDGGWTLVGPDGKALYAFQLVDKAGGQSPLEGVWRDLRRPATPGDVGLIDQIDRTSQSLTIAFAARPGGAKVDIELTSGPGGWSGGLLEAGSLTRVKLRRQP
jgi:hypothetical protein